MGIDIQRYRLVRLAANNEGGEGGKAGAFPEFEIHFTLLSITTTQPHGVHHGGENNWD